MTSPARSMSTVSPTRTSLRWTSSSLCRLTLLTVTPDSSTGSSSAAGVSAPVLPTLRVMGGGPEATLLLEVVELDHGAVGLVVQLVPLGLEALAIGDDRLDIRAALRARIDGEAALPERLQPLPVGVEEGRLENAHVVEEDLQRPGGRDRGILLPHRAGGRVARIREGGLASLFQAGVQLGKSAPRHVDLAADLEPPGVLERP